MNTVLTLTKRELTAQFFSPIAYVVLVVFLVLSGIIFGMESFKPGEEASARTVFAVVPYILVLVAPLLTMRLLSDEFRTGTIETLMTAPVNEAELILGKFLGSLLFFVVMLAGTLLYPLIMSLYGSIDVGLALSSYIGLLLVGGLFIAVGLFFSACTQNQIIAAICTLAVLAVFTFLGDWLASNQEGTLRVVLQHLSIRAHYEVFIRGLIDSNHVVFFVTSTALFLFFGVKVLEFRRWR